ncbi:MAG: hypothetical protein Ct9H300mP17_03120 [Candidatus Nitrosopelagicus sp.]|nr:MAG: hypothetical protein Ct9H300mP17_03120 [Candidatus Nitrosopelagicus sp.]
MSDLIDAINAKTITRNSAKVALQEIEKSGKDTELILRNGSWQVSIHLR